MPSKNPIVLFLIAAFVLLMTCACRAQGPALDGHRAQKVSVVSREKGSGRVRWRSQLRARIIKAEGTTYLYFEEKGEEPAQGPERSKAWTSSTYSILEGNKIRPYLTNLVVRDSGGRAIEKVEKFYDHKKRIVVCNVNGRVQILGLKSEVADKQDLAFYLMGYPFDKKNDLDFLLVTHTPAVYAMTVKYRGKESINVGGRSTLCHKLEMLPDIGILNFLRVFFPKTYLWFEAAPPHYFVRYEGLESGLGTPYVVVDAVRE